MVIGFHFYQLFATKPGFFEKFATLGQTGVDLFFVLSGFLITRILLASKDSAHFFRNFYARRTLRIFPLYYISLLAIFVVLPSFNLIPQVPFKRNVWFWIYLQNIPMTFNLSLDSGLPKFGPPHFWSLAIEEQFYLVWPFLVARLSRRHLLAVTGAMVLIALSSRLILIDYAIFYFSLARLDGLAIGAAIALLEKTDAAKMAAVGRFTSLLAGGALVAVFVIDRGHSVLGVVSQSTLFALMYGGIVILLIEKKMPLFRTFLSHSALRSVGQVSYCMYVIHPFVLTLMKKAGAGYNLWTVTLAVLIVYLTSWLSWHLIERPFLRLKKHFDPRLQQASKPSPDLLPTPSAPLG